MTRPPRVRPCRESPPWAPTGRGARVLPRVAVLLLLLANACGGDADSTRPQGPAAEPSVASPGTSGQSRSDGGAAGEGPTSEGPIDPGTLGQGQPVGAPVPPRFIDVTAEAGLDFHFENGARGEKLLPETMGAGCAFLDHDGDGDADILLVGGRSWPWDGPSENEASSSLGLFENDGTGHFSDASVAAGLDVSLQGMGVAVGDVEGDGSDDLYITVVGPNRLFTNQGGFFLDGTAGAGVAGGERDWSTAAGFFDLENDGDLDLLVGNYVVWSREIDLGGDRRVVGIPGRAYAPPMAFDGTQPLLFVNRGDGVFDEGAAAAGLHLGDGRDQPPGKMLAFLFVDIDDDRDTDVFVSNDTTRNLFFVNDGTGHFEEQAQELGLAYDRFGNPTGAMGVDGGAFANDERLGLFVGNFADEMSSAYVSRRSDPFFSDETVALGLGQDTRPALTFGLLLFDADLDGWLDLLQVNGHLEPTIDSAPGGQHYRQPPQLFLNAGAGGSPRFRAVAASALGDLARPLAGRAAARADVDGDGDQDLLLTEVGGSPHLLRNEQHSGHHWLRLALKGRPGSPSAVGAEVWLTAGGVTQRRRVDTTASYLSQVERTLHFGLGEQTVVTGLAVRWPDGSEQELPPPGEVDTTLTLVQPVGPAEVQRTLNVAKAQLEAGKLGPALKSLGTAAELAPESAATFRNLARARLAANDPTAALEALDRADALRPDDTAAFYLRAMALLREEQADAALPLLEEVVRRAPDLAAARFQLASTLSTLGRSEQATEQLEQTVALDPSHGAAFFQLAVARRRAGDMDGFRQANREFLRLRSLYGETYKTPLSLEACRFTLAEAAGSARRPPAGRVPPPARLAIHFAEASDELLGGVRPAVAAALLSMDDAGAYALLSVRADGVLLRHDPLPGGGLASTEVARDLGDLSGLAGCVVGNIGDARPATIKPGDVPRQLPDLFLYGPRVARLLQGQEDGSFRDVTGRAGLEQAFGVKALFVDHEHDGDLDLALAGADGFAVFVNDSEGGFERSAELPALEGAAHDLLAVDFDGNGAVDFAVARDDGSTPRLLNRQAGRFVRPPDPPGPWPGAVALLADDLDADGVVDAVLVEHQGVRFVFDGVPGQLQPTPGLEIAAATLLDPDADGWLDLLLVGRAAGGQDGAGARGRLVLLRNGARGAWADVTTEWGLGSIAFSSSPDEAQLPALAQAWAADLDGDGDQDILLRSVDGRLIALRTDGGEANGLLKLRLLSLMSPSGALGARVELRQGAFFASRTIQAEQPVEIGLGGRRALDSVLVVWPYGVVDTRTDVQVDDTPLSIVVIEKADTGSCPFLYVWDGERMRFIKDTVGSGATDLPLSREQTNPVDPHEIVLVGPAEQFPTRDGKLRLALTSELREAAYFDDLALLVADHPEGTELVSTDRMQDPPFEKSEVWALGHRVPLRSALGSDGMDRTSALTERDGVHAPPGPVLAPPLRGECLPMSLELDFGPLDPSRPLVLALSGWIEFGTASTMIALSQRHDVELIWPRLEARDGTGAWHPLDVTVGILGGKRRTIPVSLQGLLPEGADRLRLTTTFELHWDRIALFERVPLPPSALREIRPDSADLHWRGFSELAVREPTGPRLPDYEALFQQPPWRTGLQGWCTRYGDVLPLLGAEDGKLVVLAAGDELTLGVPLDDLPPVPPGLQRSLLWRAVGYNKEADPNNAGAGRVWPLGPDLRHGRSDEQEDAWRVEWNTRWVAADRFDPHATGTR